MPRKFIILTFLASLLLLIVSSYKRASIVKSAAANHVVISEVQVGGGVADDEFVELYNPTDSAVDISSWSIQRESTAGSFEKKNFEASDSVPSHGYFLIANSAYDDAGVPADLTHSSFTLSSTGTTVFIVNDQTLLTTGDEVTVVDKVAIGSSALDAEGSPFADIPAANSSVERKPGASDSLAGNGDDTDNNSNDFATRVVSEPQNASSASETPTQASVTPSDTPTVTPSDTSTETPSETPIPTETLTPTPTETPTETPSQTPSPTEEPTATPELTATPTVEPSLTTTPIPSPTPTPSGQFIGAFIFPGTRISCSLKFQTRSVGFLRFFLPRISCVSL